MSAGWAPASAHPANLDGYNRLRSPICAAKHGRDGLMLSRGPDAGSEERTFEDVLQVLVMGRPSWYPLGAEVATEHQIPVLPLVEVDKSPSEMLAFDKVVGAADRSRALINFYVDDRKLRRLIRNPERFITRLEGVWGITSPDFSVWDEAPPHFRVMATWLNRALGRMFIDHGLRVVPSIRWCDRRDYDHCFLGVTPGSVVAISNNGLWRKGRLRHGFIMGLGEMVERLSPPSVFLYGTDDRLIRRELGSGVEVIHYPAERARAGKAA